MGAWAAGEYKRITWDQWLVESKQGCDRAWVGVREQETIGFGSLVYHHPTIPFLNPVQVEAEQAAREELRPSQ